MIDFLKRRLLVVVVCAVMFIFFFTLALFGIIRLPGISVQQEGPHGYEPAYNAVAGVELALIYIGSSSCAFSTNPELPQMIETAKEGVKKAAMEADRSFTVTGIAKDWDVRAGVTHLETFGTFDEIMTGRSWMNEGVLKYIWQTLPGTPSTPQVLVVERNVSVPGDTVDRFKVSDEKVIVRKVGLGEIQLWVEAGTPLPLL
ncbi:MAG: hypothetical protein OXL40_00860 [Bacteroidota bacterium]|nr:hypothetical protein [Bacteroidota bacterium]